MKESVSAYVKDTFSRARHTDLKLSEALDLPEGELFKTEEKTIQLSSERLDAVIAKAFNLSRDDAQALFVRELVYVNGKLILSASYTPKKDELVSVRGHGRFIYKSYETTPRKGKLSAKVNLFV